MMPRPHARTHAFVAAGASTPVPDQPDRRCGPRPRCAAGRSGGGSAAPAFVAAALTAALLFPGTAAAQDGPGGYVSFNGGTRATSLAFDDNVRFTEYQEDADFTAVYDVGAGLLFDAAGGVRLPSGLGFGVGLSRFDKVLDPASIDARIPHPFHFDRSRSLPSGPVGVIDANGSASDLTRLETAVHVEIRWFAPVSETVELAVFGGPTFFNLDQDLVTAVAHDHVYPYDEATLSSASKTPRSASAVGFHAGADVGFFFSEMVGVGAMLRYSAGSVDLPGEGENVPVDVGGFQVGGGLRLRF